MTKYFCVFVLLIAIASTQQASTNQFIADLSINPQLLSFRSTSQPTSIQGNFNGITVGHRRPNSQVVTFDGEYTTSITNDPDLRIKFTGNQVSILNGCNNFNGQYEAQSNGCINFGPLAGTKRACQVDFDSLYTTALANSVTFERQGDRITFRDSRRRVTITLTLHRAPIVSPVSVSLAGKYSTNLLEDPNITIQFEENRVGLSGGCNGQGAEYKALPDGSFSVGQFISTLRFCQNDRDSVYTGALARSTSFVRNADGTITFRNSQGQITLILTPFVKQPKEVQFEGTYRPSITDDSDLLFEFSSDSRLALINSCNTPSGSYKATDDGAISFGPFRTTRRFCQDDKDAVYTNALSNSVRFVVKEGRIILLSSSGQQILVLTPIGIVPPSQPSVCKANEVLTPSGCWNSCADPRFKQCPDVFITIFRPEFCAYTRDGNYVSETFECQACQRQDALAVRNGACSCDFIKCGQGEVCQNGQCTRRFPVDPLPCRTPCPRGFSCQNGQCVRETPIDRCATIRCGFGTICRDGRCVQPTPVDNCAAVTCPFGSVCRDGRCIQNSIDLCASVRCQEGSICQNGRCVVSDRCSLVRCGRGQECRNGQCVAIEGFCGNSICAKEFICSNNRCVPCLKEQTNQCSSDLQCRNGQSCQNRQCVPNKCLTVKCFQGSRCDNGKCVPDIQRNPFNTQTLPGFPSFPSFTSFPTSGGFNQGLNEFSQFNQNQPFNQNEPAGEVCGTSICRFGTTCRDGRCVAVVPGNFK